MRASVFIATSLDGFIARENDDLDWLPDPSTAPDGEDYGYKKFMESVDVIIMGRGTYEKVLTFGGWHYDKPVVILTSRPLDIPPKISDRVEVMTGGPGEILNLLAERGNKHAYVDGGITIQRFLEAGLIDRLILTRIPILIGKGKPLFGPTSRDIQLSHIETRAYKSGLVQSEYETIR